MFDPKICDDRTFFFTFFILAMAKKKYDQVIIYTKKKISEKRKLFTNYANNL